MTLRVVPEGLAAARAALDESTARLAAAHAGAAPLITAVMPAEADQVPLRSSAEFSGIKVGESCASYTAGDSRAAASYVGEGGCNDGANLDGLAAGGAFGAVECRASAGVVVGGSGGHGTC